MHNVCMYVSVCMCGIYVVVSFIVMPWAILNILYAFVLTCVFVCVCVLATIEGHK